MYLLTIDSPFPLPHILFCASTNLTTLDSTFKWDHAIHVFLSLAYFTLHYILYDVVYTHNEILFNNKKRKESCHLPFIFNFNGYISYTSALLKNGIYVYSYFRLTYHLHLIRSKLIFHFLLASVLLIDSFIEYMRGILLSFLYPVGIICSLIWFGFWVSKPNVVFEMSF